MHALHSHIDKCTGYLICSDYLQKTRANMESNHQMSATKWTFSIASVGSVRAYHGHAHLSARTHAHTHTHTPCHHGNTISGSYKCYIPHIWYMVTVQPIGSEGVLYIINVMGLCGKMALFRQSLSCCMQIGVNFVPNPHTGYPSADKCL